MSLKKSRTCAAKVKVNRWIIIIIIIIYSPIVFDTAFRWFVRGNHQCRARTTVLRAASVYCEYYRTSYLGRTRVADGSTGENETRRSNRGENHDLYCTVLSTAGALTVTISHVYKVCTRVVRRLRRRHQRSVATRVKPRWSRISHWSIRLGVDVGVGGRSARTRRDSGERETVNYPRGALLPNALARTLTHVSNIMIY